MWKEKTHSEHYYSKFPKKLILDYLYGNPRTIAAINFFLSKISSKENNSILDIGCGIGWSGYEMATKKNADIFGIDLSENSINTAKSLFQNNRLKYEKGDILTSDFSDRQFNIICFLDVFEHIPCEHRKNLYNKINTILKDKGKVLLTCPTVKHQEYLRKHNPDALQPVDEDVSFQVLSEFSEHINGEISYFETKSIWNANDYFHCCIERGHLYEDKIISGELMTVDSQKRRIKILKKSDISNIVKSELMAFSFGSKLKRILKK